jgi:hypothetical protein
VLQWDRIVLIFSLLEGKCRDYGHAAAGPQPQAGLRGCLASFPVTIPQHCRRFNARFAAVKDLAMFPATISP